MIGIEQIARVPSSFNVMMYSTSLFPRFSNDPSHSWPLGVCYCGIEISDSCCIGGNFTNTTLGVLYGFCIHNAMAS
jgi:hypothetical protein